MQVGHWRQAAWGEDVALFAIVEKGQAVKRDAVQLKVAGVAKQGPRQARQEVPDAATLPEGFGLQQRVEIAE